MKNKLLNWCSMMLTLIAFIGAQTNSFAGKHNIEQAIDHGITQVQADMVYEYSAGDPIQISIAMVPDIAWECPKTEKWVIYWKAPFTREGHYRYLDGKRHHLPQASA